jgi:hypothetical protein
MKRGTDNPMLRGEFDSLQRRRRIKFAGEFSITPTSLGRLSAQNRIVKTKTRLCRNAAILRINPSDIPEMNIGKMPTR